ncbi:MAG: SRPBCC domain-containing protein [Pseudomonadota bacterium]
MNLHRIRIATVPFLVLLFTGCASLGEAVTRSNEAPGTINWPADYAPKEADFFVHNRIDINAPPETVWNVIVQAETWPDWYEGAFNVDVKGESEVLDADALFTWKTMGLNFESRVTEFEPYSRLSWESKRRVIRGYHAWLLVPTETGTTLITDESQHGFLAYMQRIFTPNKLRRLHDVWLAEIKARAESKAAGASVR